MTTANAGGIGEVVTEYSTNGTSWNAMGDWEIGISFDAWDRDTGSRKVLNGDEAIMGTGKLNLTGCTVNAVYSDGDSAGDLFDTVWTQHSTAGGGTFMVRYSPQGTSSGKRYLATNADAIINSLTPPDTDVNTADPLAFSFHVQTSGFDKGTH